MRKLAGARSLVLGLAVVLFFAPTASAAVIDHVTLNGNDYYLISENTASGAEIEAQSLGGHLATITSQYEHDFLWAIWGNNLGSGLGLWIGLSDRAAEGNFVWLGGEPVSFTNWFTWYNPRGWWDGEPNNAFGNYEEDFVVMDSRRGGRWNDVPDAGPGWRPARGIVKVGGAVVEPPQGPGYASPANNGLDPLNFGSGMYFTVATLNLPAGNYILDAKVLVGNRASSTEQFTCSLRFGTSDSGLIDIADVRLFGGAPYTAGSYATLPLAGSISLSSNETIKLICVTMSPYAFAQYPKMNAVKVETLQSQ